MKYCKFCGTQIADDACFCSGCGKNIQSTAPAAQPSMLPIYNKAKNKAKTLFSALIKKPHFIIISAVAVVAIIVLIILLSGAGKCDYSNCSNKTVDGSKYCYSHKCAINGCESSRFSYSNYCYTHYTLYDDDAESYTNTVYDWELKISTPVITTGYSYTYASGTITNNSDTTVEYVKIKGAFKTSTGTVIDTDWTYAVGSEGLAPGESCTWKLSVPKDSRIKKCEITILDYDY